MSVVGSVMSSGMVVKVMLVSWLVVVGDVGVVGGKVFVGWLFVGVLVVGCVGVGEVDKKRAVVFGSVV